MLMSSTEKKVLDQKRGRGFLIFCFDDLFSLIPRRTSTHATSWHPPLYQHVGDCDPSRTSFFRRMDLMRSSRLLQRSRRPTPTRSIAPSQMPGFPKFHWRPQAVAIMKPYFSTCWHRMYNMNVSGCWMVQPQS